jgi:hypothetical protein
MRKRSFKFLRQAVYNWFKLFINPKIVKIKYLDIDQSLLFEGAKFRLLWKIDNAYIVILYVNGSKIGSFLPNEFPIIIVQHKMHIVVEAYGILSSKKESLIIKANKLLYTEAPGLMLKSSYLPKPSMVKDLLLHLKYKQPITPQPLIELKEITLDTPYRINIQKILQQRIAIYQENLIIKP